MEMETSSSAEGREEEEHADLDLLSLVVQLPLDNRLDTIGSDRLNGSGKGLCKMDNVSEPGEVSKSDRSRRESSSLFVELAHSLKRGRARTRLLNVVRPVGLALTDRVQEREREQADASATGSARQSWWDPGGETRAEVRVRAD